MASYSKGEYRVIPAVYEKGKLIPDYFYCSWCYHLQDNQKERLPYDLGFNNDVPCPECGTQLITDHQVQQVESWKNDPLIICRYPGWLKEDRDREWAKWQAEHPDE